MQDCKLKDCFFFFLLHQSQSVKRGVCNWCYWCTKITVPHTICPLLLRALFIFTMVCYVSLSLLPFNPAQNWFWNQPFIPDWVSHGMFNYFNYAPAEKLVDHISWLLIYYCVILATWYSFHKVEFNKIYLSFGLVICRGRQATVERRSHWYIILHKHCPGGYLLYCQRSQQKKRRKKGPCHNTVSVCNNRSPLKPKWKSG